ncbi:MAG: hypothetical protein PHW53_01580 [Patescibacteria group bacterium]|nr:hypothetical protein [Patescibacteria group bacterium]
MTKEEKIFGFLIVFCITLLFTGCIQAMSSTNYIINWDSLNIGGTDFSSSTNYFMSDTLGEMSTGRSSSTNYWIYAGYRQGVTDIRFISFDIGAQANASKIDYSAFSNAGKQVTVSSAVGYSVGDYIVAVENAGASQMIAIGKISSILGNSLTVDKWDGDNAAMSAVPAGGNDWVYELSGNTVDLGTLLTATVGVGVSFNEVSTNADNGYTVSVKDDGNLRDGLKDIDDVIDGAVTAGIEEYGIETVGTNASGTNDFALESALGQSIQVSTAPWNRDRIGVIYKAGINYATQGGSYSHIVSYYVTANF